MYDLHSDFDVVEHKKHYVHYLEIIITEDGKVHYALPSHQEYLIRLACNKLGVTREGLDRKCPADYYGNYMVWLCGVTGAIAVWEDYCEHYRVTYNQRAKLTMLKRAGLYLGEIPEARTSIPDIRTLR